ncbi:unnamed protein product [Withania somnifera]
MESLKFQNVKLEKANAVLRYKKRQRVTTLFGFIELCIFFIIVSRISTQLPLNFKLTTEYFKGLRLPLISPRLVFVLVNAIVIILFIKSGHSSAKDGSPTNVEIDLYEQKYSMNEENTYCEQSKKQSVLVEEAYYEQVKKQSILAVEKRIPRSHSGNSLCLSHDEKKPRKKMIRSATVGCLKALNTTKRKITSYPEDGMSNDEFRKTVEAFIARQQRFLKEQEFSDVHN